MGTQSIRFKMTADVDPVEDTIAHFSRMYLGGIPQLITDETAFLSFILVLAATEALAGFRYNTTIKKAGTRFNTFVRDYFPSEYKVFTDGDRLRRGFSASARSPV